MTEHHLLAPLLRTALEVYLFPRKEEHCPHFGGVQEFFLDEPITAGICTASGEAEHMGLTWSQKVCMQGRPCPFYKGRKVGNTSVAPGHTRTTNSLPQKSPSSHRPRPRRKP